MAPRPVLHLRLALANQMAQRMRLYELLVSSVEHASHDVTASNLVTTASIGGGKMTVSTLCLAEVVSQSPDRTSRRRKPTWNSISSVSSSSHRSLSKFAYQAPCRNCWNHKENNRACPSSSSPCHLWEVGLPCHLVCLVLLR